MVIFLTIKAGIIMKISQILLAFVGLIFTAQSYGYGHNITTRKKREFFPPILVNPYGGVVKLIIGIALPISIYPGRVLAHTQNLQFQYSLPQNASNLRPSFLRRRRRSSSSYERAMAYNLLEQHFDRNGIDGKECIMKSICEAAETPLHEEGLIGELLHLLLTPDYGGNISVDEDYVNAKKYGLRGEDCEKLYQGCPKGHGILDHVSTVKYVK